MPSKLEQLQQQFRQRLNEERMIKIHTDNQQKALSKVSRYTNGFHTTTNSTIVAPKPPTTVVAPQPHHSPIKKGSPGVDRSRPLPPIFKEQKNTSSNRSSPVSLPVENVAKTIATVESRSRSVDLDLRNKSPNGHQNGRIVPPNRNGHATSFEPKQISQTNGASEKKPSQDTMAKLKQAELQRLKVNMKVREDPIAKNGTNGAIQKSSSPMKKPMKAATPIISPPKPKPKAQATAAPARRLNAPASKPNARNAQQAANNRNGDVARKPPGPGQEQCNVCGRNFNQDRIEKHVTICKKAAQKKLKVFDATKMRVKGTEAEQFVKKGPPKNDPKPKKSDWRKKHNEFIEAIRQAKMVQQHLAKGGKVSDLPPPPPSDTSDYVPCPHCGRKFNQGVAERHIPKCKNILSNKKNPNAPPRRK